MSEARPIRSMSVEISYGDDEQHPRHERLEWITEVYPVTVQIEKHLGHPKVELGDVVLTASRYPVCQSAGPTLPLPRLGTATTEQLLKELEARLELGAQRDFTESVVTALTHVRKAYSALTLKLLRYRTVDGG